MDLFFFVLSLLMFTLVITWRRPWSTSMGLKALESPVCLLSLSPTSLSETVYQITQGLFFCLFLSQKVKFELINYTFIGKEWYCKIGISCFLSFYKYYAYFSGYKKPILNPGVHISNFHCSILHISISGASYNIVYPNLFVEKANEF